MKRKAKAKAETVEEWWVEEEKKPSWTDQLKTRLANVKQTLLRYRTRPSLPTQRPPILPRLRAIVALLLLVTYTYVTISSVRQYPTIILLTFPTMWVLIDYIRELTKRRHGEE